MSADGRGSVSHTGGLVLTETLRATGLGRGLSEGLSRWRAVRVRCMTRGKILLDLAASLALGGHCFADVAAGSGRA